MKINFRNSINLRLICSVLTLLIFITQMSFGVSASSGTIYESESNNTVSTADRTYDDRDNYGTISYASDVDWWVIDFNAEGVANFWLGDIPSGCDYDLRVYDYTGTKLLVESIRSTNVAELCKIHVRAGETYYIKISGFNGTYSSSRYTFRVKRYDLQDAKIFTARGFFINTRPDADAAFPHIWGMGYGGMEYLNSTVVPAYNVMPTTDIYIASNHGDSGFIEFNSSYLTADTINAKDTIRSVSTYSTDELSNTKLVIYSSCNSGVTETEEGWGNLVEMTLKKGAFNCIGWEEKIKSGDATKWLGKLFEYCEAGENLGNAISKTNTWAKSKEAAMEDLDAILAQKLGGSRVWATLLG